MSKILFVFLGLTGLFSVGLAQTQCLPQVRLISDVRITAEAVDEICNATTSELNELAASIVSELYVPGSNIPTGCTGMLLGDAYCKETKGKSKSKSNTKDDRLEFDVAINCTEIGSSPCNAIASRPNTSARDVERMFRDLFRESRFRRPNFSRSLSIDDMTVSVRARNKRKPQVFCQDSSTNDTTKRGRKRKGRPRSCGMLYLKLFNDLVATAFHFRLS